MEVEEVGNEDANVMQKQIQKSIPKTVGNLNPAAPVFNPNSDRIVSTNSCTYTTPSEKEKVTAAAKESTAHWVQRAFKYNAVGINTS